ncbi:hypothetical protein L3Q82_012701 [Scortum barcoo]|uniref:Uncharacterized protein n=1 Tax=Scortum barcoo TaxID=214431 RepID=A0ACB8W3D9_9TELE|nr:hypothetical protein L3Q82_012701 [Scortum barcoo]
MGEVRGDGGEVTPKTEVSEVVVCCLTSEESGEIPRVHTNTPLYRDHHVTEFKLLPPTAVQDDDSSTATGISTQHEQPVSSSQDEGIKEEQGDEDEMFLLAAQLQKRGELMDSDLLMLPQDGASDSVLVQRPYLCRRCDRVFQHLESYVGHLKEHRQFLCLVCGKGFSQKSNLTRHVHVHTGVKPFRCPLCHKTFSQKATLQDHLNLHTGDKPHKCNYCAVHFAHKAGLRRHLKDIHVIIGGGEREPLSRLVDMRFT